MKNKGLDLVRGVTNCIHAHSQLLVKLIWKIENTEKLVIQNDVLHLFLILTLGSKSNSR